MAQNIANQSDSDITLNQLVVLSQLTQLSNPLMTSDVPQMPNVLSQNADENSNFFLRSLLGAQNKVFSPVPVRSANPLLDLLMKQTFDDVRKHLNIDTLVNIINNSKMANHDLDLLKEAENHPKKVDQETSCLETHLQKVKKAADENNNSESDSEDCSLNELPQSQIDKSPSPLLCFGLNFKKSIRKQTSFAKTDVKSITESVEDHLNLQAEPELGNASKMKDYECMFESKVVTGSQHKDCMASSLQGDEVFNSPKLNAQHFENSHKKSQPQKVQMVGLLTTEQRHIKVKNYLLKKQKRKSVNNVRYECRQNLAQKRFRYQGRFVKLEDLPKFGKQLIIDFNGRKLLKPVFQIEKVNKRLLKLGSLNESSPGFL